MKQQFFPYSKDLKCCPRCHLELSQHTIDNFMKYKALDCKTFTYVEVNCDNCFKPILIRSIDLV